SGAKNIRLNIKILDVAKPNFATSSDDKLFKTSQRATKSNILLPIDSIAEKLNALFKLTDLLLLKLILI
ncbi:hypothetical protein ACNO6G_22440, partial [Vibrio harveyi]|uniref:hypothetical protein n=1 Tax=Vibrio harveyi TaxID=669 RepID=UPI003AACCE8C